MYINFLPIAKLDDSVSSYKYKSVQCGYFQTSNIPLDTFTFSGKKDLLKKPKDEVVNLVKSSINSRNKIGEGFEAAVYRIKGTDYCFRKPFNVADIGEDYTLKLSEKDKINHVVAKFLSGCQIMNFIKGKCIGDGKKHLLKTELEVQKEIEDFPVRSYSDFLKQISYAYKKGMVFDSHSGNVVINVKDKTFTIIDFYDKDECSFCENYNLDPLASMFYSIMNSSSTTEQMHICLKKILTAALKDFSPNNKSDIKPEDYDFCKLLHQLKSSGKISISDENYSTLYQCFEDLVELKDSELAGKRVKGQLNSKLSEAKKIVNELL